jgi:hypothetical protein
LVFVVANIPNLVENDYKLHVVVNGVITFWVISISVDGHLGGSPTWGIANGTQTFRNAAHKLGYLLVLCHGFPLLDHKHMKSIHKSQKFFG